MNPADVDGLIPLETGLLLQRIASQVPVDQCIVEIGAFKGRSTCFLASGAREGVQIFSIDAHGLEGSQRGRGDRYASVREEYLDNIKDFPSVHAIHSLSENAPQPSQQIGLLWIDGDHSFPAVKKDVDRFAGLVAVGGYLIMDDFNNRNRGVQKMVGLLRNQKRWGHWDLSTIPVAVARRIR